MLYYVYYVCRYVIGRAPRHPALGLDDLHRKGFGKRRLSTFTEPLYRDSLL